MQLWREAERLDPYPVVPVGLAVKSAGAPAQSTGMGTATTATRTSPRGPMPKKAPTKFDKPGKPSAAARAIRDLNPRPGRPAMHTQGGVLAKAFRKLSDLSGPAFKILEDALNDPEHPEHSYALHFVLERIGTRKTFEAIAEASFGQPGGSQQPKVSITINAPQQVETLEHTPVRAREIASVEAEPNDP